MEKIKFTNLLVLCLMLFGSQAFAQMTFTGTTGPVPPSGTAGTSTFTVDVTGIGTIGAGGATLDDVTLTSLTHTFDGDLDISIIAPSGESVLLSGGNGGSLNNYIGTVFANGGNPCIESGSAPFTGTFEPEGDNGFLEGDCTANNIFATEFDGVNADGNWTLEVIDNLSLDAGFMNEWSITLTAGAGPGGAACELECPESQITATTDPFSNCSAFVDIPQPLNTSGCDLSTLTNDYNGTTDASDVYPLGTTLVTYSIIDEATGNPVTCTVEVTVVDLTAPVFTDCPGDMTINLDAGECEVYVDFNIRAEDECNTQEFEIHQNGGLTLDPSNFNTNAAGLGGGGVVCQLFVTEVVGYGRLFDLQSYGVGANQEFVLNSVDFITNFNSPANPVTVNVYSFPAGTAVPTTAGQTLLGTATQTFPVSTTNTLQTVTFATPISVPAGQVLYVTTEAASNGFGGTIFASEGGAFGGAPELFPSYVFGCPSLGLFPDYTDVDAFFPGYSHMLEINGATLDPEVPTVADPNNPFANGDALPIGGPYEFTYTAEDNAGNVSTCTFEVTVQEFPDQSGSLTCNDHVNISLDDNCEAVVGADDILEGGQYGCYDDYIVNLFFDEAMTQPVPTSPLLTSQNIGQTLYAQVVDPQQPQQNNCWGTIFVEDKIIPALECGGPYDIACTDSGLPSTVVTGTSSAAFPSVATQDNATVDETVDVSNELEGASITDLDVQIFTDHTWVGDLVITVTSPSGTSVELLNNLGGPGFGCNNAAGQNMDVVMDDEAAATYADMDAQCPPVGSFQPLNALSAFDGENPSGTWTVEVEDLVGGDGGNVEVTLVISSTGTVPFPLPAGAFISPQDIANGQPYTVIGFDPCGATTLTYEDVSVDQDCQTSPYIRVITRTWTAVDQSGNETTCTETFNVVRSTIDDVVFPANRDDIEDPAFSCTGSFPTDANGNPHPSVSGFPTINGQPIENGDDCEFAVTYEDQEIPVCEGTVKIIRTWTVLAWCPTTEVINDVQIIKVVDDQGPNLVCPADFTISTGQNDCTASAILPAPQLSDPCSPTVSYTVEVSQGTLNAAQTAVFGLPLGQTTVTYTAVDGCGNVSTCTYIITVTDQVPPVAICESFHVVGLTIDEPTLVPALVFDDGSYDNCELVEYSVRRMDNPNCPGFDGTPFGPTVPFYCCDVGGPNVMVELRVRDAAGNTNSCMVEVEVQDKLNPAIACPPNKVLDCWEDPYDLALTGEATATDNCSATVTYFDNGNLDNCGEGTIFRIWTATDPGGRTASCVQRIDVINSSPFFICDTEPWNTPFFGCDIHSNTDGVEWPADIELNTCGPGLLPEDLENNPSVNPNDVRPRIFEDPCELVGFTYEDVYLPITPPACVKVLRTWKVYDWCTFDEDNFDPNNPTASAGYWEYTQIIKVLESDAPTILSDCNDVSFCSYDPNCAIGPATLLLDAEDDCTAANDLVYEYKIDAFNDGGDDIIGQGADASGNYPIGTHKITWYVEDGCGNVATCDYIFVIADCKNPTPNLLNGIATEMMEDCSIEIWAEDFDNPSSPSFDNCGIDSWLIVSPSQGPGQTVPPANAAPAWTFSGVGDLGTNTVDVWILDVNGNWAYVSTYILVQDNLPPFCTGVQASISGGVETEEAQMVENTMVYLNGGAPGLPENDEQMTGVDGEYGFPGLANGGNYVVTPEKDVNPLNGVSTYDLVKISQHILEVEMLPSPYKMIAADVNNDGNISAVDLVHLRRLILFIDTEFQNNTSWRFVESDFVFPNPQDPWETSFPEIYSVNGLDSEEIADFVAMKIGDVNCSASPNSLVGEADDRSAGELTFGIQDQELVAGETYTVDFSSKDFAAVYGYQFTLGFDNSVVEFEGIEAGTLTNLSDANFGMAMLDQGVITTSWNNSNAVSMDKDAVLFSVTFTAQTNAMLSEVLSVNSRYTRAEAYDSEGVMDVNLEFNTLNGVVAAGEFELYQNQPNPFKDETTVSFNLPEAGFATLTIYDVSGKLLYSVEGEYARGYNEVNINRSDLAGSGVLYYQLDSENNSATKKMILIK